jgi:hypothetical protein
MPSGCHHRVATQLIAKYLPEHLLAWLLTTARADSLHRRRLTQPALEISAGR